MDFVLLRQSLLVLFCLLSVWLFILVSGLCMALRMADDSRDAFFGEFWLLFCSASVSSCWHVARPKVEELIWG